MLAAQEACWRLNLDRVLFLPVRQNPLKVGHGAGASADDRCEMVRLAIEDNPLFELSRLDLDRPPPWYTVDLLRILKAEYGHQTELFFIAGADILPELPRWYAPRELISLATLAIITRPGWDGHGLEVAEERLPGIGEHVLALRTPGFEISATEIRSRIQAGQPIRYLMPRAVEDFIYERGLYRQIPDRD